MSKLVSVVMSVYNTDERYLRGSIESILAQTYQYFEFIIVLDHPTDGSDQIVREYESRDSRIVVLVNEQNLGLTKSLNIALGRARGEYIARMDADDYSVPDRLEIQVGYLDHHPDVGVVGGLVYTGIKRARFMTAWNKDHDITRVHMLFHNAGVAHPTAMYRREMPDGTRPVYDERIKKSQDFALWADLIDKTKIVVLDRILLIYRVHPNQITADHSGQMQYAGMVCEEQFKRHFGIQNADELELLKKIYIGDGTPPIGDIKRVFAELTECNEEIKLVPPRRFSAALDEILLEYCYLNRRNRQVFSMGQLLSDHALCSPQNVHRFVKVYFLPKLRRDRLSRKYQRRNKAFLRDTVKLGIE